LATFFTAGFLVVFLVAFLATRFFAAGISVLEDFL
jgi:hypothetical protein